MKPFQFPPITVPDLLTAAAGEAPESPALYYQQISWTYARLAAEADAVSTGLLDMGIRKGDRVAVMLPNLPEFVASYFGILRMGGIVVAINPTYTVDEVLRSLNTSGAVCLIALETQRTNFQQILADSPVEQIVVLAEEGGSTSAQAGVGGKDQQIHSYPAVFNADNLSQTRLPPVSPEDPAIFQFSGGTTGTPKAAVGLHKNIVANVYQFRELLKPASLEGSPILAAIPLFHVYGMVLAMSLGVLMRSAIVLIRSGGDLPALLKGVRQHHPVFFPGVPNLYAGLLRHPLTREYTADLQTIKVCISGSTPLPAAIQNGFEKLIQGRILEGFGLSEAPTATHCNPVTGKWKVGSIGPPLPGVECRLVDLETQLIDVPAGMPGELLIRGPQVMAGYHGKPEETRETLKDGWLHTGDIATVDADGYYFIKGRKKDLIKVGGFQVWPQEIEDVLLKYPGVKEAAAAGIPHELLGEVPCAWITVEAGAVVDLSLLLEHCKQHLARYKLPEKLRIVDKMPRSTVGKVLRREIIAAEIKNLE